MIDSDIRDQAYVFFIQEAPELLQVIETELLTLRQERSIPKVHNMMRAAHSLKGGAASVGLETIKTLAHSLEDIFKALFHENLEIDTEIESLLLQAYDCLRLPTMEQITTGKFNSEKAMAQAEPVFARIEARMGDFLGGDAEMPSSIELGVDIALSIFEVDIAQGLDRLTTVITAPQGNQVAGELRAQAEVFGGIAELLNLPGFGAIAQTALAALDAHPEQALQITQLALADFQAAQQAVIAGDRTIGGAPSTALTKLAYEVDADAALMTPTADLMFSAELLEHSAIVADTEDSSIFSLDNVFGDFALSDELAAIPCPLNIETVDEQDNSQELIEQIFSADLIEEAPAESVTQLHTSPADDVTLNPSLDDVFGDFALSDESADLEPTPLISATSIAPPPELRSDEESDAIVPAIKLPPKVQAAISAPMKSAAPQKKLDATAVPTAATPGLSVRVDLARLEAMNNLVGELSINRNSLSLQNEQLQATVQELLRRFSKFQQTGGYLRTLSDQMLVAPERYSSGVPKSTSQIAKPTTNNASSKVPSERNVFGQGEFDSLEMDSYGELHSLLQDTLEQIVQIEEKVGDVVLLAGQSSQTLEGQRQMIGHFRDDLMWARMLPISEVLNRFPRMLRDLSTSYEKPVDLKLIGTEVLVDKAALEKLHDPLMHLLRNAFDHGIETPDMRLKQGKAERGQIEVRVYHQGSQTIIEIRDDGRGLNFDRIKSRALNMGLLSPEQLETTPTSRLVELLFEPGFSTASQVSELSGRGVGLDVVRSQLRSLKGSVSITSEPGIGTTFTLRIPLTLTIAKLLVCFVGSTAFALPSDSIEELLIPQPHEIKQSGKQRFLHWGDRIVPAHHLSELLHYACPVPEAMPSRILEVIAPPADWASPMLVISQDNQTLALEIDRVVTEQELVIKPFGAALTPPNYMYGCTILGDGSLIPVIDGAALLNSFMGQSKTAFSTNLSEPTSALNEDSSSSSLPTLPPFQRDITPTLLVVDDSITLRQTLALTFEKAGYRVLQARDGREAIEQMKQNSTIQLVVCDIEMPNMNGFEFLSHRRTDPLLLKVPTVMLTSRSSDKHRQLATHLGANGYFTKPFIEQEFLAALSTIIKQEPVRVPALAH